MKNFLVLVLLITLLLQAACGPAPANESEDAAGHVEVIWFVRPDAVEQQWENGVIADFETKFPNIKVLLQVVAPEEFDNRMQVMTAAGTPPDIFSHWGTAGFRDYLERDLIADLTPYIERDELDLSDFQPVTLDPFTVEEKIYGLPMHSSGSLLFYNKDLLDQAVVAYPPTDWDDTSWTYEAFLEKCDTLTKVSGSPEDVYGCSLNLQPYDAYPLMWGQDLYPEIAYRTGFAEEAFLNTPAAVEAFQARQDIVWRLHYMPSPAQAQALGGGDLFETQKVAVQLISGNGWWKLPFLQSVRWGAAALPFPSEGRRNVTFTDLWMLSSKTKHPEEAWTFLKYLVEAPQQESWMNATGAPPVRLSLEEKWFNRFPSMPPEEMRGVHLGALKYGLESPRHMLVRFDRLDRIVSTAVEPVINNEKDAAELVEEANVSLIETLKQIQAEYRAAYR